jgi:hypothetical protein
MSDPQSVREQVEHERELAANYATILKARIGAGESNENVRRGLVRPSEDDDHGDEVWQTLLAIQREVMRQGAVLDDLVQRVAALDVRPRR